jgi:Zn-dependent peptidase ImmA (M78 family)
VIAQNARFALEIRDSPVDMVDLLENRLRKNGIHYHVVDERRIPGDAARAIPEQGLLLITKEAYFAVHLRDPRQELLVPHELAHFALRHAATFARTRSLEPYSMFEDSEVQADQFSHEFVMPPELVRRHCQSIEDIQRAFNVPIEDARIRQRVLSAERAIKW